MVTLGGREEWHAGAGKNILRPQSIEWVLSSNVYQLLNSSETGQPSESSHRQRQSGVHLGSKCQVVNSSLGLPSQMDQRHATYSFWKGGFTRPGQPGLWVEKEAWGCQQREWSLWMSTERSERHECNIDCMDRSGYRGFDQPRDLVALALWNLPSRKNR